MQSSLQPVTVDEPSGIVFDVQRFSIHDGPGIRSTVFLKGCPLRCTWCQNPESQEKSPQMLIDPSKCGGCGRCIEVCPEEANELVGSCIKFDREKCILCGKCVTACPNEVRRISGKTMTVSQVVEEVLRDRKFYETSGGGVTISGGEVTFQADFAEAILRECKKSGLHTAIETCGYTRWHVLEQVLQYVDYVLYDIKQVNDTRHRSGTGVSNELILENAVRTAKLKPVKVRVPLIPGFNDSKQDVREIASFVATLGEDVELELLAYNPLGEGKHERLGMARVEHKQVQSDEYLAELRALAEIELRKRRLQVLPGDLS